MLIANDAKEYVKEGVLESVKRNSHMNNYEDEEISQTAINAILVDFINFVGMRQGVDFGMYTKDLHE